MNRPTNRSPILVRIALIAVLIAFRIDGGSGTAADLVTTPRDRAIEGRQRDAALAAIEKMDFPLAENVAAELLPDQDRGVRFRAAWILAEAGREGVLSTLRDMAREANSPLTMPILALGVIRDEASHQVLRELVLREFNDAAERIRERTVPRLTSLVIALGDYGDAGDADELLKAVRIATLNADWRVVEAVGRICSPAAVPWLEDRRRSEVAPTEGGRSQRAGTRAVDPNRKLRFLGGAHID